MFLDEKTRLIQVNVDVQNDFCPGGSLAVENGDQVTRPLNVLARRVRQLGGTVIHTRDWHPTETNHFVNFGGPWPEHCVAGTFGAEFHKNLEVVQGDIILSKGAEKDEDAYSGFQATNESGLTIAEIMLPKNNERVAIFIGGLATDYCVKATVIDALKVREQLGLTDQVDVIAVIDAMKAVNIKPNDWLEALQEMRVAGAIQLTSGEIYEIISELTAEAYRREQ